MQRIMILGPPGSGKSRLAQLLGARLSLPVFHLDQAYWRPGWIKAPPDEFRADMERIAALPAWIIDGNYTFEIEARFHAADTMIYLDVPSWLSLVRIIRRVLASHGKVRADASPGCPEKWDWAFMRFTWNWNRSRKARTLRMTDFFDKKTIVLRGRAAVRRFLEE
jgi:adenylate kinase family enzyme